MAAERWRIYVSGRVQGVGYRAFVQKRAAALGLVGYVRNLPDGRVEAEAEGEPEKLRLLRRAMQAGPRRASVASLAVETVPPTGAESRFAIR